MATTASLKIEDKEYPLPIMIGTEGEKAVDTRGLRAASGYVAYDQGYGNTGSCESQITYLDGDNGILRHRGYPIEQLAHYTRGALAKIEAEHGIAPDMVEVVWQSIIAEQKAPHDVVIIEWGEQVQAEAQATLNDWLGTLKLCLELDQWPGRGDYAKVQSLHYNTVEIEGEDA